MRFLLHRATRPLAAVAATLILAGCLSVEYSFTINDDGTADIGFVVLVDVDELSGLSEMFGEEAGGDELADLEDLSGDELVETLFDGENPCDDLASDLSDYDVETRNIDNGGEAGVECTVSGVSLEELQAGMEEDGSTFVIEHDDEGTRFEAVLLGVDELAGETASATEGMDLAFDELFSIVFNVEAPGSLGDNNASSTSGATATWTITPDADFVVDGDAEMHAEWTPGSESSSGTGLIIGGVIAGGAILGAVVLLVRRGKGEPDPTATADSSAVAFSAPASGTVVPPPPAAPTPPANAAGNPPPPSAGPPPPPPPPTSPA